jgi:hypothetical protein
MKRFVVAFTAGFAVLAGGGGAFAAHPLITDDTGTQGKGKAQLEFVGEYGVDKEEGVTEKSYEVPTTPFLSYGITDEMDIVFGLPHASVSVEDGGTTTAVRGVTDMSIELKARFYENNGLSFALKPGVSLPTGDEDKGLGNGKVSYGAFFISTKEMEPWAFHFNLGYLRNVYKLQADKEANRKDIWRVSLAAQVKVVQDLAVAANIGRETNSDKTSNTDPAFILGGVIYSITEDFDIDFGIKAGLNKPETDISYLAGAAFRF